MVATLICRMPVWCAGREGSHWHLETYWSHGSHYTVESDRSPGQHEEIGHDCVPPPRHVRDMWRRYEDYCRTSGRDPLLCRTGH